MLVCFGGCGMKIGTFDPDLKAHIDSLQAKIYRQYDWMIRFSAHPDTNWWLISRWYAEKWELVKRI